MKNRVLYVKLNEQQKYNALRNARTEPLLIPYINLAKCS